MSTARSLRALSLALLGLLPVACTASIHTVQIDSHPVGARVLKNGQDTGLTTPTQLNLSTSSSEYTVTLEKAGYNPSSIQVSLDTDVEVMSPGEAFGRILCAPCCLGFTLPGCLTPVDVDSRFVPGNIHVALDIAGQGARLQLDPPDSEVYVNGRLSRPLDQLYVILDPGDHEIEIRREGYRPFVRVLRIQPQIYQDLEVVLEVEGQGILLNALPPGTKVYVDDQYQGAVEGSPRRLRTAPGPHVLRLEYEGLKTFEDVILVNTDEYKKVDVTLTLDGEGIHFDKPSGVGANQTGIEILVDGALQATSFDEPLRLSPGEHELEVRVPGFQVWITRVRIQEGKFLRLQPALQRPPRSDDG